MINLDSASSALVSKVMSTTGIRDADVISSIHLGPTREALLSSTPPVPISPSEKVIAGPQAEITRSALASHRRWLAADCALTPESIARASRSSLRPELLCWDDHHQLYYWPNAGSGPTLSIVHPSVGQPLTLAVVEREHTRVAVGVCLGYTRSPYLAVTGGDRTRDIVGLYDCDSRPGDCGSLVLSQRGVVGLHAGTMVYQGRRVNAYYPFLCGGIEPEVTNGSRESEVRQSHARPSVTQMRQMIGGGSSSRPAPPAASQKPRGAKKESKAKREGIVSMSPSPSDLPSRQHSATGFSVQRYVDVLLNPWAAPYLRLPDHVVVPTSMARFVKNSTWTVSNTATLGNNLFFGLSNRPSCWQNTDSAPIDNASAYSSAAGVATIQRAYTYGPGSILSPLQWGTGAYADPSVAMAVNNYIASGVDQPWGDDFGPSMRTSLPYMAAHRTLSMAIRVRIVGLPTGQFMTPGKIYFTQVRCDSTDLPITEQDFSNLEQLGRATHVSADAVRAAGSKTLFYVPDGQSKFNMVSTFLPPCGSFGASEWKPVIGSPQAAGLRSFPTSYFPVDFRRSIIPYRSSGVATDSGTPSDEYGGSASAPDSANADGTSFLFMAYFGAQDGVVLEVDYAQILEYIPTKSAPGGVEAMVQLPDSLAMDQIFSAAAVVSEARPVMLQQPGDLSLTGSSRGTAPPSREAMSTRNRLSSLASGMRGKAFREGFWDFNWLKKGTLGDPSSGLRWDFTK